MSAKYIFVTGGVVSSLGKGLAAASIGCWLGEGKLGPATSALLFVLEGKLGATQQNFL